ncbi:MAG: histidinol-phosphatase [Oscillospiraceae bacterium]
MLANYHTHTKRCKHAWGEDREYVESAIHNGMKVLGFSDHCPWIFPDNYESNVRMNPSELDNYFDSLISLREEYKDDITVYIGFESEYIPESMEEQEKLFEGYPIDYMILGEHFMEKEPSTYLGKCFSDENLLERFVDICIEGMETGKYKYLAHPDLMGFTGAREIYDKHYTRLCQYLKEHHIPVEINLLGVFEKRHYTDPHFLKIAGEIGCQAIIGCDAHTPDRLNNRQAQAICQNMAAMAGMELVDYLPDLLPKNQT